MDFQIGKKELNTLLKQILSGQKSESRDFMDMTADRTTLTLVVTGRSVAFPIEAQERGSFTIPIGVLFKVKKIAGTYEEEVLRIRVAEGKFRLQGMSISHPDIKPRKVARRIIDIPDDAYPRDILSLAFIFTLDEIEDCGLHTKLLEAQKKMAENIESASASLRAYGFDRNELAAMAKIKIKAHADSLKHVLFSEE